MQLFQKGVLVFFGGIVSAALCAQISSPEAAWMGKTNYNVARPQDPIFTFIPASPGGFVTGSLEASPPDDTSKCDFTWTRYNSLTNSFDIPVKSELSTDLSKISSLSEGGYQVRIVKTGSIDTIFRTWIFLHDISADALETPDGKIPSHKYTCAYVELNATVVYDSLIYFDPSSGNKFFYSIRPEITWDWENEKESRQNAFTGIYARNYSPSAYDTRYYLKVTDPTGILRADTVFYESIQTEAIFSYKVRDSQDDEFRDIEQDGESAPLDVQFSNASVNGVNFSWKFYDTLVPGIKKTLPLVTTDTIAKPEYTYYIPRNYFVTLISMSAEGCIDSVKNTLPIIIKKSKLAVPNCFTPDVPGENSRFLIIRDREEGKEGYNSIREFSIFIYSRWGAKVYEYEGDINDWEGWDGTIKGSNRPASEGYYYYVISAVGYDRKKYEGEVRDDAGEKAYYTGFLYLFR